MSKTFSHTDSQNAGKSNTVESVTGSSSEKSGVLFDLTPEQQEYARELLAEGVPKSKVIQMVIEEYCAVPLSKVIAS
ncbi:MAG: hypothetical protein OSA77_08300 [Halioglobus sp.]|nr:hypothetical protein [Halioglobus sp.]